MRSTALTVNQATATVTIPIRSDVGAERREAAVGEQQGLRDSTTDITRIAVHGPTRTAASAPPMRWPLVPTPTGS